MRGEGGDLHLAIEPWEEGRVWGGLSPAPRPPRPTTCERVPCGRVPCGRVTCGLVWSRSWPWSSGYSNTAAHPAPSQLATGWAVGPQPPPAARA